MPDPPEPRKKAIEYEVPFRQALDDELKTAKEDGDEDTQTIIRRLKVREIKKLSDESEKLDLEEAIETQRVRVRNLKQQKKGAKPPTYVETEENSQNTNAMKEILGPDSLKILRDMKPEDRDSLLRSINLATQGSSGKGLQSIMPLMLEAQKNVGSGSSTTDIISAADKLLNMYWKGRDEKEKELIALATSAPSAGPPAPAPKGFLEELLDDELKTTLKDNFRKVLSGNIEPAPAAATQVNDLSNQPIRMIQDPETKQYYPEIVPNLEEYYKVEDRIQARADKIESERKSDKREDDLIKEVIKPLVKSGTKMIDEEVKKIQKGRGSTPEKPASTDKIKASALPPTEHSFPCTYENCKGIVNVKVVDGKWPPIVKCPTCEKEYASPSG